MVGVHTDLNTKIITFEIELGSSRVGPRPSTGEWELFLRMEEGCVDVTPMVTLRTPYND